MSAFDKAGIRFSVITPDRTEEVLQLLAHNFFPDEPLLRSVGIKRNSFMDSFFSDKTKASAKDAGQGDLRLREGRVKSTNKIGRIGHW